MSDIPQEPTDSSANTPKVAADDYVNWFRHASPYINAHRDKTFVIMLPGECIDEAKLSNIIADITLLSSLGVRLVIVHGARNQIDKRLDKETATFFRGHRITSKEDMRFVLEAVGYLRLKLEAFFSSSLPSTPMQGAKIRVRSGNFITAMPQGIINGVDLQYTGKVRNIDRASIENALESGAIVLVSPLGYSATGEIFNLNMADATVSVALGIRADKVIAYNDDGPIKDSEGQIHRELTLLRCKKFLVEQPEINQNNTYFSLRACYKACDGGVSRSHVISAAEDGALLKELYTRDGSGTMVHRDSYETIRRARIEDVQGILALIEPLESDGILVKRSRELLEQEIHCFIVMEKDSMIIGCAALYPFSENGSGEFACVAIHEEYRKGGRAAKLLTHVERQALKIGIDKLYVLTTQTAHWFIEQGFVETMADLLPVERKALYNYQRKSKVFVKHIHKI